MPILGIIASQGRVAPTAYESIATYTLGTATSTVTFDSIPATFKHLQIRMSLTAAAPADTTIRFNGDTGSNYDSHLQRGTGTTTGGYYYADTFAYIMFNIGFNTSVGITDILDYTNTNKYTTIRSFTGFNNNGSGEVDFWSGLWSNTSAISSFVLTAATTNFSVNSKFALYGIKG